MQVSSLQRRDLFWQRVQVSSLQRRDLFWQRVQVSSLQRQRLFWQRVQVSSQQEQQQELFWLLRLVFWASVWKHPDFFLRRP